MLVLVIGYIVFFIGCVLIFNRRGATKVQDDILWGLLALGLAMIAYLYDPVDTGFDVIRHYERIERIRQSNTDFGYFILRDSFGYGGLYTFNAICYLIAKLNINEHFLPFLVTLISYWICFYILRDWTARESISHRSYILSLLVGFSFMPYYFVMTGIRNGVAMCIMALALYLYLYREKSALLFLAIGALASTIHTSALIVVPFVFISRLGFDLKYIFFVLVGSLVMKQVATAAAAMGIPYISSMAKSYLLYSSENQFRSAQYFVMTDIFLIILFSLLILFQHRRYLAKAHAGKCSRLYNFISLYAAFIIGNVGNYDLVLRPAYLFGPLAPMLSCLLYNDEFWKGKMCLKFLIKIAVITVCTYTIFRYMAYFFASVKF